MIAFVQRGKPVVGGKSISFTYACLVLCGGMVLRSTGWSGCIIKATTASVGRTLSLLFSALFDSLSLRFSVFSVSHRGIAVRFLLVKELFLVRMKAAKGKGAARRESRETLKVVEDRKVGKRKAAAKPEKSTKRKAKKEKLAKDPNKPKRPPSAFFVFLEEFRKTFKKENPNVKAVSAVGKAGGEKWKSMSEAEKAPYEAKAAKKKSEYEKLMNAYNKKQESMADDGNEESERSKSEVNDENDEESGEEEEEEEEEEDDDEDD